MEKLPVPVDAEWLSSPAYAAVSWAADVGVVRVARRALHDRERLVDRFGPADSTRWWRSDGAGASARSAR